MSDELKNLYQEVLVDHGKHPRNFFVLPEPCFQEEGYNPLCGDRVHLYFSLSDGKIEKISFQGEGCAISMASASLLTELVANKSKEIINELFSNFHTMLTTDTWVDHLVLGKLNAFEGVRAFPMRVKCATLAWHALMKGLKRC